MTFQTRDLRDLAKPELYRELAAQLRSLIKDEPDRVANLANAAALIFHSLAEISWCGFYLLQGRSWLSVHFRVDRLVSAFR